ncbi:unnamed protein product [Closterium sp. NIES-54]
MTSLNVLTFDAEGRAVEFEWLTRDAAARLAVRNHLPSTKRAHFSQYKSARALYDAVVARYSSPTTAALSRLRLPYLFPDLAAFATVADLVAQLRTSDARYRAALPTEFLPTNSPPHGCSPVPLLPSVASAAAVDLVGAEEVSAASASSGRRRIGKGKGSKGGGGGGGGSGGGGRGGGGGGPGGGGVGGGGGGRGGGGGGRGGGGSGGGGSGGGGAGRGAATQRGGLGGGQRQQQLRTRETPGEVCGLPHTTQCCFGRLTDAWRTQFPDAVDLPHWHDLLLQNVPIFDLDFDAILAAMYALADITEGDCYLRVPPDPGTVAAALGASASAAPGACAATALGASASDARGVGTSPPSGTSPTASFHTFTLDSGASRSFFRDSTTLTPLIRPVAVSLADPSGGPVLAHSSTILPCPAAPSGLLSGLHLPSFSTNLVSGADLQDAWVDQFTPGGQRVTHCTCSRTGRHLATFTRRPGSSLYTLTTAPPPVSASSQVAASSQVFAAASRSSPASAPCSCRPLAHETLLWHHRLGHPSLPRLRGMASRALVSGLPRSLPPLPLGPAPTCVPCVEGRQRAAPHSSSFPPTEAPLQTLHMDVWGPARVRGQGHERYFLLVVDDYSRYTTVFPLRSKGEVTEGIRQTFTLPASPQQNGIAERRIGMVMDVTRTSMIHAAAPHFLWPFAVQYAAHQINLQPRVSLPETTPTLRWTGKVGDASAFRVWGSRAFVRDPTADKLSSRALKSIEENGTWELVELPEGRKAITSKWLFKIKSDADGKIERYKSRLVAKGYQQKEKVDYKELFAPVVKPTTLRTLLAGAAIKGWVVKQMDVTTAFLNGVLEEEIFMAQPEGQWYLKLRVVLEEIGFTPSFADHSLFMLGEGEQRSFMVVYADDILIFSPSSDLVKEVMLKLQDKFKCKALGDVSFYLGLHIERDMEKRCMRVHQRKYLEALAANFGQSEGHVATPFPSSFKCVKGPEEESVGEEERRRFHSLVGSLMYAAVNTRPDVAFATGKLARVVQCPNEEQVAAGMRVAKYLGQTPTVGLQYSAAAQRRQKGADGVEPGRLFLTAFSDASYASEPEDMTSVGGFICCVGGGPTTWESKKQVDQALSSVESEYMALFRALQEIVWQQRLLAELGEEQQGPTPLYCDSQGVIALANNPVLHGLTKHMRVKWHWTRSMVAAGEVELHYVKTTRLPDDMMTKRLVEQQHWKGLTERREPEPRPLSPASRAASLVRTARAGRVSRPRLPPVPGTHSMTLRPSTAPQRVPLPSPPASSLPDGPDPESDSLCATSPTITRFLATAVTDPLFESSAASALVAELVDFAAACRLDYAASIVAESVSTSVCPPSVGGECALGTDVLEDRQEDLECFAAASPHLVSMLLAPEGDPDALDIPTPRSYAEAIEGFPTSRVRGQGHERYFLLVVDDYSRYTTVFPLRSKGEVTKVLIDWIRAARLRLRESFGSDFPVLRLHSDRGGEFSSALLGAFCRAQGIHQTFTLPASPQKNGIAERRIGMVMDVARTSMIHAAAPHFLWPFAVQYAAHQLNLQPRVSLPETSPTLLWTGKVGDASVFRVWGSRAFVRDLSADKLSPRASPCVFLGFPPDAPGWQFYHPTSRRVLSSQDVTFDESVPYYRLFPYRTASLPPPPLFLAPGPPQVDPLPPPGPAPSGVSQVDAVEPVEVAADSGAATGAEPAGAGSGGAGSGGAETEGAEPGGAETRGIESGGAETWGAEPGGAATGGAEPGGAEPGGTGPGGAGSARVASRGASSRREVLSPQELREWFAQRWGRAAGAGGTTAATGSGGTCPGGAGAAGPRGTAEAAGVSPPGGSTGASGGTRVGAAGGVGAGGSATAGPSEGAGAGAAGAGGVTGAGAPAGSPGVVPAGSGGTTWPRPYFVPLLEQVLGLPPSPGPAPPLECPQPVQSQSQLQPISPLPAPSPYTGPTGGLAERRAPASRPASPARPACTSRRTSRPRPPAVPGTHQMALRPSTAPLRVSLPSPPVSSLPDLANPESDSLRAASPTVARFLATIVTDPSLASTTASALVAELVDFAARCRLDYAASLVAESASVCPPSVGDPDAPDIPTPRSYAEAIEGPYSSQWQAAMDAEMASWKSTGTYVDEVPPPGANIVSGMWIFMVKRPPGSPPVFKARYVARGFSQRQGVDYFQTFSPTPKMTTLRVLLHVAAQRDYELNSLDFSTAFLQGSLHEEIWLRRPPCFTGSFPPGTQWSLRRPVYGLRQAPREWHDTLRTTLAALRFAPSTADPSLFLRTDTALPLFYVLVYVDDLVFATADTAGLAHVKSELQKRHTCTDLGVWILGVHIRSHTARLCGDLVIHPELALLCLTGLWVRQYGVQHFGEAPRSPPVLYVDNKAMLALCQEHRLEHRTKHIALRYFVARELQQHGQLRLAYVASPANTADVFTKALQPCDHQRFCTVYSHCLTWHAPLLQPTRRALQPARRALLQPASRALLPCLARAALHCSPRPAALQPAPSCPATRASRCPALRLTHRPALPLGPRTALPCSPAALHHERHFLLFVDVYTRYTTIFPLRRKADVSGVLIPWIRATRRQLRERFRRDFPVLRLHSDRGKTSPAPWWTGKVGDASVFRVWGTLSLVRYAKASKLSSRTLHCVFLGFPTDDSPWQSYHPRSRAEPGGAETEGEGSGGAAIGGAGSGGAGSGGAATGGAESGGAAFPSGGGAVGDPAGGPGAGQPPQPDLLETLSPQVIRAWIVRRGSPGGGGCGPAGAGAAVSDKWSSPLLYSHSFSESACVQRFSAVAPLESQFPRYHSRVLAGPPLCLRGHSQNLL